MRHSRNPFWPIGWLVLASLFYYGWWQPRFLLLLLFSIAVNLVFGKLLIDGKFSPSVARLVLAAGIVFNLSLLGYFKYAGFLVANVNGAFGTQWAVPNIILPIGISFITFQKIAFLVDAYRGLVRNFTLLNYALFVTFFPQLIAGPIVHHAEIMPQLATRSEAGLFRRFRGWSEHLHHRTVQEDRHCRHVRGLCGRGLCRGQGGTPARRRSAWIAVLSYCFQLYYDFSGYSDMAVGLGRMFGIRLPINFYSPYQATSSSISGGAGTCRCRASCATTCISRSGATAAAGPPLRQPDDRHAARRPVARRQLDLRGVGWRPRPDAGPQPRMERVAVQPPSHHGDVAGARARDRRHVSWP